MGKRSREKRSRRTETLAPRSAPDSRPAVAAPSPRPRPARPSPVEIVAPPDVATLWRTHRTAIVTLFAGALVVRALLLLQIAGTPYFEVANIDSAGYHRWATRIVEGAWWPTETFYQSPLYAYFLACLYTVFGNGSWSPRVVQIVFGSVSPVLLYAIGTRLFSRRVGWIAGIGLALYGPIILEEITFSKTTLLIVTALAGFALYLWGTASGRTKIALASGLFFGVSVVGVGQWLLPYLGLVAWTPVMAAHLSAARRRSILLAFAAGGLAIIVPLVLWNSAHGGGLVLTSGDAGLNFYNGNNARATGLPAPPPGVRDTPQYEEADARRLAERAEGRSLAPAEVASYWTNRVVDWILLHPGDWIVLLGRKLATLWNGDEIPDNYAYGFMRANFLSGLRPLVTFGLVAPLALVGAFMPFWRRRDVTALYIACFVYVGTMLIFYIRGRYRIPAAPFLMLFSAVAIERLWNAMAAQRWQSVGVLAAGLVVAGVFTNQRYCEAAHDGMNAVCLGGDTWFDQEWLKLAEWYRNKGDLERAVGYGERAAECSSPRSAGQIAFWIGELHKMRAEELVQQGRRDEAAPHLARAEASLRQATQLGYKKGMAHSTLGSVFALAGKPAEAVASFEAARALGSMDAAATQRFAQSYVALGRCADGERLLAKLDRERGFTGPSDDTRVILSACGAGK